MEFILSQVFGGIALILVCISYFMRNKTTFLFIQIFVDVFYAAAFLVVGLWVAGFVTTVSIIRCLIFLFNEKCKFKFPILYLMLFITCNITIGIVFASSWLDIVPVITSSLFTFAFFVKNMQLVRGLCLVPNLMLICYNITCKTFASSILDLVETIVLITALIKFYVESKKVKNNAEKEICETK